jgi:hypothetical protein
LRPFSWQLLERDYCSPVAVAAVARSMARDIKLDVFVINYLKDGLEQTPSANLK